MKRMIVLAAGLWATAGLVAAAPPETPAAPANCRTVTSCVESRTETVTRVTDRKVKTCHEIESHTAMDDQYTHYDKICRDVPVTEEVQQTVCLKQETHTVCDPPPPQN